MNKAFLYDLMSSPSVSGYELPIQKKIHMYMEPVCDDFIFSNSTTLTSVMNKTSPCKVLLCAHVDEIGFYVNRICDNGLLQVIQAGGVHPTLYLGSHIQVVNELGSFPGVVVTYKELEQKEVLKVSELYLDMGYLNSEDALKDIQLGDPVCASVTYHELANDLISGRAIDNKGGTFIVLEAMRKAKEMGAACGIYGAATTGEETTCRGAYFASQEVNPTCAIIVDVTYASDVPGAYDNESGDVALGKGPVLCKSSTVNVKMIQAMADIAQRHHIPFQWEVMPSFTHTDGDTVFKNLKGIPICLISLPLRYMHSSIETASLQDMKHAIDLIAAFLVEMNENFIFNPFE